MERKILVAVTGASGMLYLEAFLKQCEMIDNCIVEGICSESGKMVLGMESGIIPEHLPAISRWHDPEDFAAPPASGSSRYSAMVILPCSMGTLGAIASGLSINLIHRAADVMLKEQRPLILSVRETPLNRTHLQNMLKAQESGAVICPPMPSFYFKPKTLQEAAESYGWRVMDQLGISVPGRKRWGTHE